jgi:hypothetical protein
MRLLDLVDVRYFDDLIRVMAQYLVRGYCGEALVVKVFVGLASVRGVGIAPDDERKDQPWGGAIRAESMGAVPYTPERRHRGRLEFGERGFVQV